MNVDGTWRVLGTLSSAGAYNLNVSGITTTSITTAGLIVSSLTGYVYCNGAAPCTASTVIPPSGGGIGPIIGTNMNTSIASYGATATNANVVGAVNLTASLTVPSNVTLNFQKGGCITQTGAFTLTINGSINASEGQQLFCGFSAGQVTFASGGLTTTTFPEWWGAVPNGSTESGVAIQSATSALPSGGTVKFMTGTYTSATCGYTISVSSLVWEAPPSRGNTLVNCSSASATILTLGTGTPFSINRNAIKGGFLFNRTAATPSVGSTGVYINGTVNTDIDGPDSINSQYGWRFKGFANGHCTKCTAEYNLSTSPGGSSANAVKLFLVDLSLPAYSSFLVDTFAFTAYSYGNVSRTASDVYGYSIENAPGGTGTFANDIWLDQAASSQMDYPVFYNGAVGNAYDVFLINNIHDFFNKTGVTISGIAGNPGGAVTIQGGWFNPYATGAATIGLAVNGSFGVNVTGGAQFFAGGNFADHTAISCDQSGSLNITGNRFMNAKNPIILAGCYNSTISGNSFWNLVGQSAISQILVGTSALPSSRISVTGNSLDGYATNGIDATYGTYSTFAGNICNPSNMTNCEASTKASENQSTDNIQPPDTTYSPAFVFTGGTTPSATVNVATFSRVGNIGSIRLEFVINHGATAPTSFTVSLPAAFTAANSIQTITGRNTTSGDQLQGVIASGGTVITPLSYSNATPINGTTGNVLVLQGTFQLTTAP